MEAVALGTPKTWVLRVDIGEDVLESIQRFLDEKKIRQGYIAAGYGALTHASLHWVRHNRLPTENLFAEVEGGIEILAMSGLIVGGEPHVHVALSTPTGAFGGHLEPGSRAYVLCEIVIVELDGAEMTKPRVEIGKAADGSPVSVAQLTFAK